MLILHIYFLHAVVLFNTFKLCISTCGKAQYEVDGRCCPMCGPGHRVYRNCSESTSPLCAPCSPSTFTDLPNRLSHCFPCTVCDSSQGLRIKTECTLTADTICEPREGFYCIDQHKHSCRAAVEHSKCKPGQYIIQNGTADTDTVCGDCVGETYSDGSFSSCLPHTQCESSIGVVRREERPGTHSSDTECEENQTVPIIHSDLFVIVSAVGLVLLYFCLYKKRKSRITGREHIYFLCTLALFHNFQICISACGKNKYEVDGRCCPMCGPGHHVYRNCTEYTSTSCELCTPSTFTDSPNGLSQCLQCTVCDSRQGLRTKTECTSTADTICEPREGFYCIDQHKHSCRAAAEHSKCKPGQYIIQNGTADTDTVCGDCVGETYSDGSFTSCLSHAQCESSSGVMRPGTHSSDTECEEKQTVPIILGVLSGVLVIAGLLYCWYKKRKSMNTGLFDQPGRFQLIHAVFCLLDVFVGRKDMRTDDDVVESLRPIPEGGHSEDQQHSAV